MKKIYQLVLFFITFIFCTPSFAQFKLVKDINTTSVAAGSGPFQGTEVNGILFFVAFNELGYELWKTDGTAAGTKLVKDINSTSSAAINNSNIYNLININGTLFFTAVNAENNNELWKSNGDSSGTVMVKEINPGLLPSDPKNLTNVNGTLYFSANDGQSGTELWKSDGTNAGTVIVKDIYAGANSSAPQNLININGRLFFSATDGINGQELWKSDGTAAGTVMVKDIYLGINNSLPQSLTELNGSLYFVADDGISGREVWKSDGTNAGTVLLKDIFSGNTSSSPNNLIGINNLLFFVANNGINGSELWKSDGTNAGTILLKDIRQGPQDAPTGTYQQLINVNGILNFLVDDGTNTDQLWRSDGTIAGTFSLKNIGPKDYRYSLKIFNVNNDVYFTSREINGYELWKNNGTTTGTTMVKDINAGAGDSYPQAFSKLNGVLYFSANDGVTGQELWKSDGTQSGTVLVKDIYYTNASTALTYLTPVNNKLFFIADDGVKGQELWQSDGTGTGTFNVKDICPGLTSGFGNYAGNRTLAVVNNTVFFQGLKDCATDFELWKSDGTEAGTMLVKDINPGIDNSSPHELTNVNGTLFFAAYTAQYGAELWKSDGTEAGTVLVKDIMPGNSGSYLADFININGTLYFRAFTPDNGDALYKSDGTNLGTVLVKANALTTNPLDFTNINGVLYYNGVSAAYGNELWKSDGTNAGTVLIKDINPGVNNSLPANITNIKGIAFFTADDGINGRKVWRTDGTQSGTQMITGIYREPDNLINFNDTLYFTATDSINGRELWKINPITNNLTVINVRPGAAGSNPGSLTVVDKYLLFAADDGIHGAELWVTSGTSAGTYMLQDLVPGSGGSIPINNIGTGLSISIVQSGDKVYTTPVINPIGKEIWVADISFLNRLKVLEFTVHQIDNNALLQWKTINENNTVNFTVERSIDGVIFSPPGNVAARNLSNTQTYQFVDSNITSLGVSLIHYRLRQNDIDGVISYSPVVDLTLTLTSKEPSVLLSPNPVANKANLIINLPAAENVKWFITDNIGRVLQQEEKQLLAGISQVPVELYNYSAGIYYLSVNSNSIKKVIKFVKY